MSSKKKEKDKRTTIKGNEDKVSTRLDWIGEFRALGISTVDTCTHGSIVRCNQIFDTRPTLPAPVIVLLKKKSFTKAQALPSTTNLFLFFSRRGKRRLIFI